MKLLKVIILTLIALTLLSACGEKEDATMLSTAETLVQALIDGDEETIEKLNRDTGETTESILQKDAPKFSGLSLEDFTFEINEEKKEVKVLHESSDKKVRYWWIIEKINEEYVVTYF
ncbi:MAG: hypothetical protein N2A99_06495 [Carnobacterium alterfunditum]